MVDYDRFSEDRQWTFEVNESKKAWKREQPKVYRGGKRFNKTKNEFLSDCEIQSEAELDQQ